VGRRIPPRYPSFAKVNSVERAIEIPDRPTTRWRKLMRIRQELQRAGELMSPAREWPSLCPAGRLWKVVISESAERRLGELPAVKIDPV
jgi:hypothetical protein